jgi:hypothetical protein
MSTAAYECTYRHVAFLLTSICVLLVAMLAAIAAAVALVEDTDTILSVVIVAAVATLVLIVMGAASSYAMHRWTIEPTGLRIEEAPKVRFMGPSRRCTLAFADIAALRHLEGGLDTVIEIVARDGLIYRLMAQGTGVSDLQAFAKQVASAAESVGHKPPPMTEGLSFWNRPEGFVVLGVMLAFTLLFAGATAWALFDGGLATSRSGYYAGLVLLLPFGVVYLICKSITRRWQVLKLLSRS